MLRNVVTAAVRCTKRDFFVTGAKFGSKFFWRHVKRCIGLGKIKSMLTPWPCHTVSACKKAANCVYNVFVDTVERLTSSTKSHVSASFTNSRSKKRFSLKSVSISDVRRIIAALPDSPEVESHGISLIMLRKSL